MKTLKQIREEYNGNFNTQVEELPGEFMLGEKLSSAVPSSTTMPSLLIFRRVSYRLYPNKQVVALYYSKLVDKYLSIPFGPTGNLNLSEAVVLDEDQLDEMLPVALGAAGRAALGIAGKYLKDKFFGDKKKPEPEDSKSSSTHIDTSRPTRERVKAKVYSSWEKRPSSDPVYQTKVKQASVAPIKENKISDIRKMVNEGVNTKDININGRQVTLNTSMAKRILEVYDSVNTKNKKIVESMLNEDLESFKKLLNFSVRN